MGVGVAENDARISNDALKLLFAYFFCANSAPHAVQSIRVTLKLTQCHAIFSTLLFPGARCRNVLIGLMLLRALRVFGLQMGERTTGFDRVHLE